MKFPVLAKAKNVRGLIVLFEDSETTGLVVSPSEGDYPTWPLGLKHDNFFKVSDPAVWTVLPNNVFHGKV